MNKFFSATFALTVLLVTGIGSALAAPPVYLRDFRLHDFDASILDALGFEAASITYVRELASVTEDQLQLRRTYEAIGCHPFFVFRNGKADESGFNCRSFYCVGYTKGPRVCRDSTNKPYSGVVEISRRLGLVTISEIRKPFTDYPLADQNSSMKAKIEKLKPYRCTPLFLLDFDVVVGEGYQCEEVGRYPYYSSKNVCIDDFRKQDGLVCQVPIRADEFEKRLDAMKKAGIVVDSSSSASARSSVSSSGSGSTTGSGALSSDSSSSESSSDSSLSASFPDVSEGKYGFTAIMDLTSRGIITGYPDGLFRPKNAVNRAEFVKVLMTTLHEDEVIGEDRCFKDVVDAWFSGVVCAAKRLGWVSGYDGGFFRPGQTMRKAEAMKVIIHALGAPLDSNAVLPEGVSEGQWFTPYIKKAVELDVILEPSFQPNALMTRADAAVWIYRALKAQSAGLL